MYECVLHQSQCNPFATKVWTWRKKLVIVTNEWKPDELSDEQREWLGANTVVLNLYEEGVNPQMWVDSDEEDSEPQDVREPPRPAFHAADEQEDALLQWMVQMENL